MLAGTAERATTLEDEILGSSPVWAMGVAPDPVSDYVLPLRTGNDIFVLELSLWDAEAGDYVASLDMQKTSGATRGTAIPE